MAGVATASNPNHVRPDGRPDHGAAAARTESLYRDHGRLVGGLCRGLLRDRAEAEDATQQVFLAAHRALLNGTAPREPAAWLATIARNECWGRIRTRMREPLPTAEIEERSDSDPLDQAIRNADLAAMWSALGALPPQQREALLWREFGGLSYEELAGALAVSGPAVESLLFRARQGMRTRLQAAYAGITGASWLESLARLAGGLGGGMAPVAAKVAAVSVGAAVATGGAVVAPRIFDQQAHHPGIAPVDVVSTAPPTVAGAPSALGALPVLASRPTPAAASARRPAVHVAAQSLAEGQSEEHQHSSAHRREGRTASQLGPGEHDVAEHSTDGVSRDGPSGTASAQGSASSSSGGDHARDMASGDGQQSEDHHGSEGGHGSGTGGEGVTSTVANSELTAVLPAADEASLVEVSPPGGDG